MTLIELMVFLAIVTVSIVSTVSLYVNQRIAQRVTEERRLASLVAEQKMDEIRIFVNTNHTLDQAFQQYGPLPLPQGAPGATFDVSGLAPFMDTDPTDGKRPKARAIGTVTIINDEAPRESLFGYDYANACAGPPFGVDLNGNGSHQIETGFGTHGAAGYNDTNPLPFPLDLNGSGSDGSMAKPWDKNLISGFKLLPVVVTIQWQGADGPRRFDLFSVITANRTTETQ